MSNKIRVRYLLRDPITPHRLDAPRRAVYVTLEADDQDEHGTLLLEGEANALTSYRRRVIWWR